MRIGLILMMLCVSRVAWAFCPWSGALFGSLSEESAIMMYKSCAEGMNDDASQARLAAIYDSGTPSVLPDITKALYYYQLSADNGNAASQARLAQLYIELDKNREGRSELYSYTNSIMPVPSDNKDSFKGEFLHPYVLLVLANDKADNKWYYATEVKQAPAFAANLLKKYNIDDAKKKQLLSQARAWKKRKLLEMASQLLSPAAYQDFADTLYPANGQVDAFKRSQLLNQFQEIVKAKQVQDQKSAKAFH